MRFFRDNILIDIETTYSHSEGEWDHFNATFTVWHIDTNLKNWAIKQLEQLNYN